MHTHVCDCVYLIYIELILWNTVSSLGGCRLLGCMGPFQEHSAQSVQSHPAFLEIDTCKAHWSCNCYKNNPVVSPHCQEHEFVLPGPDSSIYLSPSSSSAHFASSLSFSPVTKNFCIKHMEKLCHAPVWHRCTYHFFHSNAAPVYYLTRLLPISYVFTRSSS